jgi:hypothetical protein
LPPVTFLKDIWTNFWFPIMKYGKHIFMQFSKQESRWTVETQFLQSIVTQRWRNI